MGIGFSGQMHGLVMLDENGKPIRRSIIWCDQRSAAQTQEMCSLMPEEKWLDELNTAQAKQYISEGKYAEELKKYEAISAGFVDGDLKILYQK